MFRLRNVRLTRKNVTKKDLNKFLSFFGLLCTPTPPKKNACIKYSTNKTWIRPWLLLSTYRQNLPRFIGFFLLPTPGSFMTIIRQIRSISPNQQVEGHFSLVFCLTTRGFLANQSACLDFCYCRVMNPVVIVSVATISVHL